MLGFSGGLGGRWGETNEEGGEGGICLGAISAAFSVSLSFPADILGGEDARRGEGGALCFAVAVEGTGGIFGVLVGLGITLC